MSNILPEDVKLIAEFVCPDGFMVCEVYGDTEEVDGLVFVEEQTGNTLDVPDYTKMDELLGVITEAVNRGVLSEGDGDELLADSVLKCHGIYTDLPTVLFPLLVEAIKQIKESE